MADDALRAELEKRIARVLRGTAVTESDVDNVAEFVTEQRAAAKAEGAEQARELILRPLVEAAMKPLGGRELTTGITTDHPERWIDEPSAERWRRLALLTTEIVTWTAKAAKAEGAVEERARCVARVEGMADKHDAETEWAAKEALIFAAAWLAKDGDEHEEGEGDG